VLRAIEQLLLENLHAIAPSSPAGHGTALPPWAVAQTHPIRGQRFLATGLQPRGECHPFVYGRSQVVVFADTVGGANGSANLYSLIETAKANVIEP
jgi:transposase